MIAAAAIKKAESRKQKAKGKGARRKERGEGVGDFRLRVSFCIGVVSVQYSVFNFQYSVVRARGFKPLMDAN